MKLPAQDRTVALAIAPDRFCPRRLAPGQVKRYAQHPKPLIAYMCGCPGCGFIEMHMHDVAGFVEDAEGHLVRTTRPLECMNCKRILSVQDRQFSAVLA